MQHETEDKYTLTIIHEGISENGIRVPPGQAVEYLGHVTGGMVRVRFSDGHEDVIHPACTKELR